MLLFLLRSPSIMGILVADRTFLGEIGGLDGGMEVYGGENVELGIRVRSVLWGVAENFILLLLFYKHWYGFMFQVWTCGGSIEIIPCSKIAHIERHHKPYLPNLSNNMRRNALRVADIWMDEYKYHVNIAWNVPIKVSILDLILLKWLWSKACYIKMFFIANLLLSKYC